MRLLFQSRFSRTHCVMMFSLCLFVQVTHLSRHAAWEAIICTGFFLGHHGPLLGIGLCKGRDQGGPCFLGSMSTSSLARIIRVIFLKEHSLLYFTDPKIVNVALVPQRKYRKVQKEKGKSLRNSPFRSHFLVSFGGLFPIFPYLCVCVCVCIHFIYIYYF